MKIVKILFFVLLTSQSGWAQTITIGDTTLLPNADNGNANLLLAQNATLSQAATIRSLSFYVTTASGNLRMGIYDASGPGGGPGVKQAETNSIVTVSGWNTANVISPVILAAGTYWIAYLPSSNTLSFLKGVKTGTSAVYYSYNFGTLPATFSTTPSTAAPHWSFYATLTVGTDTVPPVITNISATDITTNTVFINWNTNESSNSQVVYGTTTSYGDSSLVLAAPLTAHSIELGGLTSSILYHYRVKSRDEFNNLAVSADFTFSTIASLNTPIKVGPTGRYLVDQNNSPFMIVGDAPQSLITNLSPSDVEYYFADRQAHGFNSMWINLLCDDYTFGTTNGPTYDGIYPFTTTGDLSTPNPLYFQRADSFINNAASHNLVVLLDPIETGGWLNVLEANGLTKAYNYGVYVGNRYKNFKNIIWLSGNDFQSWRTPGDDSLVRAVIKGIQSVDQNHLHTAELDYNVSSTLDDTLLRPLMTLNAAYVYYTTYAEVLHAYNQRASTPVFMVEAHYDLEDVGGEFGSPLVLRRQEYWTMTSGASGQLYGNHYTTGFETGWKTYLETEGLTELNYMKNLFTSVPWYNLIPDTNQKIITSGFGTFSTSDEPSDNDYVTAARTPDGKLVIAFVPTPNTFTVDMTNLSGTVTAQWYDPTSGAYSAVSGSPFANTSSQQLTPPGNNSVGAGDWVLVLSTGSISTSVKNNSENSGPPVKVYPNPARDKIYVDFPLSGISPGLINVYTVSGQLVSSQQVKIQKEKTVDVSGLSPGMYFVQVAGDDFNVSQKIIIDR